ncbi:MAG: type IV toxin-antitoxin system AbiEi family antitoxin domain-containing protein [Clostridia bacterium]|nr:type IV toxin-antitoxin system AbiEi family antitoxin domain-containing protein [Clostridia bacterium]
MMRIDIIKELIEKNNGIITTKILEENNIHRQYLKMLVDEGYLVKVSRGVYTKPDKDVNEFYITGQQYKAGIFSHNTALYFYNLTDRTPFELDMTFASNIRVSNYMLAPHYINKERLKIGITTKQLEDGTSIRVYNMERTICDIIRDRKKIDTQIFNTALKEYMKRNDKNLNLLYEYAKKFKILRILKMYMDVLA